VSIPDLEEIMLVAHAAGVVVVVGVVTVVGGGAADEEVLEGNPGWSVLSPPEQPSAPPSTRIRRLMSSIAIFLGFIGSLQKGI